MEVSKDQELLDWLGSDCWFCGRRPPVHGKSKVVNMRKVEYGEDGGMRWLYSSVAVPCCAACRAGHDRATRILLYAIFGPALAMSLIMAVWGPDDFWVKAFLVVLSGGAGGLFIGGSAQPPAGQKPDSEAAGFKAVQSMLEGGWVIMDTPPPVQ